MWANLATKSLGNTYHNNKDHRLNENTTPSKIESENETEFERFNYSWPWLWHVLTDYEVFCLPNKMLVPYMQVDVNNVCFGTTIYTY